MRAAIPTVLEGEWRYTVRDLRFRDATCTLRYTLTIHQREDVFVGFAKDGNINCLGSGAGSSLRLVTLDNGKYFSELNRVIFFITKDLKHYGEGDGDTVRGAVESENLLNTGPGQGTFLMERISGGAQ
jgi:hypothetical protein